MNNAIYKLSDDNITKFEDWCLKENIPIEPVTELDLTYDDMVTITSHTAFQKPLPTKYQNKIISLDIVETIVKPFMRVGEARELIIARMIGGVPNEGKHGHDCYLHYGQYTRNVEVKTQSFTGRTKTNGTIAMGISTPGKFDQILEDDLLMISAGFNDENILLYFVTFDFNDPGFLEEWEERGLTTGSSKHAFSYKSYKKYKSTKVHYINKNLLDECCNSNFARWLQTCNRYPVNDTLVMERDGICGITVINEAFPK